MKYLVIKRRDWMKLFLHFYSIGKSNGIAIVAILSSPPKNANKNKKGLSCDRALACALSMSRKVKENSVRPNETEPRVVIIIRK